MKEVVHLIPAEDINMGGIIVKQALPTQKVPDLNPFLLLHHAEFTFRDDSPALHQGIGPHPHRGFSPVTFIIEGEIHHRDSRGNSQIGTTGDIQWMHAGAGIVHSERPSENLVRRNGKQEIIQLWINTPQKFKMEAPQYVHVEKNKIYKLTAANVEHYKIVDTTDEKLQSTLPIKSEMTISWIFTKEGGISNHTVHSHHRSLLYLIKGSIKVKGYGLVDSKHLIVFSKKGDTIEIQSTSDSQYLLLTAPPLEEPIVQHGPFVMNTQTEILEAMRDYQMGKMGILIEE